MDEKINEFNKIELIFHHLQISIPTSIHYKEHFIMKLLIFKVNNLSFKLPENRDGGNSFRVIKKSVIDQICN